MKIIDALLGLALLPFALVSWMFDGPRCNYTLEILYSGMYVGLPLVFFPLMINGGLHGVGDGEVMLLMFAAIPVTGIVARVLVTRVFRGKWVPMFSVR